VRRGGASLEVEKSLNLACHPVRRRIPTLLTISLGVEWPACSPTQPVQKLAHPQQACAECDEVRELGHDNNQDKSADGERDWLISRREAMRQV